MEKLSRGLIGFSDETGDAEPQQRGSIPHGDGQPANGSGSAASASGANGRSEKLSDTVAVTGVSAVDYAKVRSSISFHDFNVILCSESW